MLCDGCIGADASPYSAQVRNSVLRVEEIAAVQALLSIASDFACDRRFNQLNNGWMLHHAEVLPNLRQIRSVGLELNGASCSRRKVELHPKCKSPCLPG